MNIIVLTGTFKQRPNLKNGVAYGTLKTDKMFLIVVAFGEVANEVAKQNSTDTLLIEGKLQQTKYNDEWRMQVVVSSIKPITTTANAQIATPLGEDLDDVVGNNLDDLDLPDDDLPF